jgi:hypothetical protein
MFPAAEGQVLRPQPFANGASQFLHNGDSPVRKRQRTGALQVASRIRCVAMDARQRPGVRRTPPLLMRKN